MKQINKRIKLVLVTMFLSLTIPVALFSQVVPDLNDVDAPLDGGLTLLVAAGAIAGAKKIKEMRKKETA